MKIGAKRGAVAAAIAGSLLLTYGCTLNHPVNMRYSPASQAKPILMEQKTKIFLAGVEDQTGGIGLPGGIIVQRSMADSLMEALRVEMPRLGFLWGDNPQTADAVLRAAAVKADAQLESRSALSSGDVVAEVAFRLTMADPRSGKTLWDREFNGQGRRTRSATGSNAAWNDAYNDAFVQACRKIGPALESEKVAAMILSSKP